MENENAVAEEMVAQEPVAALAEAEDSPTTPSAELSNETETEMSNAEEDEEEDEEDEEDEEEDEEDEDEEND